MIYRSDLNYLSDQTGDQMDSAVRASVITLFSDDPENISAYVKGGQILRSPGQFPANNPKNVTRDQMVPVMAALWKMKETELSRKVFWETWKRGFFSQSSERDVPGSTKYPSPHQFYKDSKPDTTTIPMKWNWKKFNFETTLLSNSPEVQIEYRYFDHADLLAPDHIWHFILCARAWPFYGLGFLGYPWLLFALWGHSRSGHQEHLQILCECVVAGDFFVKTFKKWIPTHAQDITEYWSSRNEIEFARYILDYLDSVK